MMKMENVQDSLPWDEAEVSFGSEYIYIYI